MEFQKGGRIIVLVDMDCFYVQVEQKLQPEFQNKPCAVVQYNAWKGGGIIAVNYEARAKGVGRNKRGEDAQKLCPDIHLFRVPEVRGKADLTRYREAGASVMEVLCKFSECVERASIDEAYIDLTEVVKSRMKDNSQVSVEQIPNTFVIGWKDADDQKGSLKSWLQTIYEEDHLYNDRMLATAAVVVEEIRATVYEETGYRCSAGIAHNKVLAKLTCGLHKPNKQTVLPEASIPILYKDIPVNKVRGLGGKFGDEVMERFKVKTMADLSELSKQLFLSSFGEKSGSWLYYLSRGIENEPVVPRQLPKSIGCGKNFPGKSALSTKEKVVHWVKQLSIELEERLLKDQENNCRIAKLLTISVRNQVTPGYSTVSRSCPIFIYNAEKIAHDAFNALQKFNTTPASNSWTPAILSLAISAGKFEDKINHSTSDIQSYFKSPKKKASDDSFLNVSSNIDTLVGLLDTEPDPTNVSHNETVNTTDQTKHQSSTGNSTVSKDISRFFSAPSTSKALLHENTEVKQSNTVIESSTENGSIKENNIFKNTDNASVSITLNDAPPEIEKPKVKGFFARKLEERLRLEQQQTNELILSTSRISSEQNFTSPKKVKPDSGDSTCVEKINEGSDNFPPAAEIFKVKGFFATKREERSATANNAVPENSQIANNTISENNQVTNLINSDTPSTSGRQAGKPSTNFFKNDLVQPNDDYSNLDPELTNVCTKCNRRIPIWEEEEHSDFHIALNLSKELRSESSKKLPSANLTKQPNTAKKRGRSSKSVVCKKPAQQNTIDSFFK
ncbi:hypothetical protein JTE90_020118 [Oedothorax gibbosus]|uniref:DNA polymerase eta n=1 Tax=Oedothorax gibbosus TaxID=931172 RepID=A0AAV6VNW2_9ARAC|nr:hypothetical protein JTE90_020118 [Oedothorax gibbosus]